MKQTVQICLAFFMMLGTTTTSMAQDSRHRPYYKVFICDRKTTVINLRNGAMTSTPTAVLASQIGRKPNCENCYRHIALGAVMILSTGTGSGHTLSAEAQITSAAENEGRNATTTTLAPQGRFGFFIIGDMRGVAAEGQGSDCYQATIGVVLLKNNHEL